MASNLNIAGNQRFTCLRCGLCCRRWHVAVTDRDLATLRTLDWQGDPGVPADLVTHIHGHPYLAHRANGDCVFLDPATEMCRVHGRFGASAKPVGCRVYPLNIASTCAGSVSVSARMDCPAVQQNVGRPLAQQRREIEEYAGLLGLTGSAPESAEFSPDALEILVAGLRVQLIEPPELSPAKRSLALLTAVQHLEKLGDGFINDTATLKQVLPSILKGATERAAKPAAGSLNALSRALFREWLASYLRRDEEMLRQTAAARVRRTWALLLLLAGRGSFRRLGAEHPDVPLREARIFRGTARRDGAARPADAATVEVWECYWRMFASRLETLQFCGGCYYGQPVFHGLRALILTYPLVLAAARCNAAARGCTKPSAEDVRYATGAIDHSWGRSRLLQMPVWRSIEGFFDGARYARLLAALGE